MFPDVDGAAVWPLPVDEISWRAIDVLKERGTRVLVETDDALLDRSCPIFAKQPFSLGLTASPAAISRVRELHRCAVRRADGIICSTPALAEVYTRWGGGPAFVCPSAVDPADWPLPDKPGDGVFRVGFAGGVNRLEDLALVRDAFAWASTQRNVEVVLLGIRPGQPTVLELQEAYRLADTAGEAMKDLNVEAARATAAAYKQLGAARAGREASWGFPYRWLPPAPLDQYRRNLALLDVGVCPQTDNTWARCRSDTKALDYAMGGALPVCSDAEPYAAWRNRFTASPRTANDWLEIVQWAVANRDEVRELAAEAREYVLAERTIDHTIGLWRAAITGGGCLGHGERRDTPQAEREKESREIKR